MILTTKEILILLKRLAITLFHLSSSANNYNNIIKEIVTLSQWRTPSTRRPDLIIINKKKRDFAIPADHKINLKESEKKDKYLDLARVLKNLWNMKVTIVPIVIGALGTITKGLLKGLEDLEVGGRVETIQTTALQIQPESRDESWRLKVTWCHSNSSEKPSANTDMKNSKGVNNNNNNNNNSLWFCDTNVLFDPGQEAWTCVN